MVERERLEFEGTVIEASNSKFRVKKTLLNHDI